MSIMAGEWYENVDIWAIVVTSVVALVIGWAGAWVAFRAANPKLRLDWWVTENSALMRPVDGVSITLQADGTPVEAPRMVTLRVTNTGRKDIVGSMFHDGKPLTFDLGAPVITVLDIDSGPHERAPDLTGGQGGQSKVEMQPTHFACGRSVAWRFLLDGPDAHIGVVQQPLVDVQVRETPPPFPTRIVLKAVLGGMKDGLLLLRRVERP
ncbi:hypothetical protein ABZ938_06020 [Streptomyces sp. NPDC046409]|uniref:hypothetical protein n=1 Tax=Streptomyces sp. NPDC046409 TaxID=3156675 RepID=UPI0033F18232